MRKCGHDWSPWIWDSWVLQSCWRRRCLVRGCFESEATLDITIVDPKIVIDYAREAVFPDGDVEYTPYGLELLRELARRDHEGSLHGAGDRGTADR